MNRVRVVQDTPVGPNVYKQNLVTSVASVVDAEQHANS